MFKILSCGHYPLPQNWFGIVFACLLGRGSVQYGRLRVLQALFRYYSNKCADQVLKSGFFVLQDYETDVSMPDIG